MDKKEYRDKLATNPTRSELALIYAMANDKNLRGKYKFQQIFDPYIVDFYFASCKLVVEIDGWSHDYTEKYDKLRSEHILKNYEVKNIIRFSNKEVFCEIKQVLNSIKKFVCPYSVKSIKSIKNKTRRCFNVRYSKP